MSRLKVLLLAASLALTPFIEANAGKSGSSGGSRASSSSSSSRSYSAPSRPSYTPSPAPSKPSPSFGSFGGSKSAAAPTPAAPVQRAAPPSAPPPVAAAPAPARPAFGSFGSRATAAGVGLGAVGAAAAMSAEPKPVSTAPASNSALNRSLDTEAARTNSVNAMNQRDAAKAASVAPPTRTQNAANDRDYNSGRGEYFGRGSNDAGRSTASAPPPIQQQPQVIVREGNNGMSPLNAGVLGYVLGSSSNAGAGERAERDRRIEAERLLDAERRNQPAANADQASSGSNQQTNPAPAVFEIAQASAFPSLPGPAIEKVSFGFFSNVVVWIFALILVVTGLLFFIVLRNKKRAGVTRESRYKL